MSIANLLAENDYKLFVNAENLKIDGQSKGSLLASDGNSYNSVSVGTDGQILVADSTEPNGVVWETPSPSAGWAKLAFSNIGTSTSFEIDGNYENIPVGTTLIQNRSFTNPSPGVILNNGVSATYKVTAIIGFRMNGPADSDLNFVLSRSGSPQAITETRFTAGIEYRLVVVESIMTIGNAQNIALAVKLDPSVPGTEIMFITSHKLILTQL